MGEYSEFDAELEVLNAEVDSAVRIRREWMDSHMVYFAKYKIGEALFDLRTGRELGTIIQLYRYHADKDWRYDTTMNIEYEYKVPQGYIHNTSSQPGLYFGNAADLVRQRESDLRMARLKADPVDGWAKAMAETADG